MENNNNNNNNDNNDSSFTDKRKTSPSPWANSPKNRSSSSFAIGSTRTLRRSDTAPVSNSPHTSNTLRDSKKANWSSIDFGEFGEEPEVLKAPQNNLNSASNPSLINENSSNLKVVVINEKNNQNALLRQKKNETFKCTFDYKGLRIIYHASCEATAYEIKSQILKELSKNIPKTEQQENFLFPHEYLVKVVGIDEFIDKDKQQLPLYPFPLFPSTTITIISYHIISYLIIISYRRNK